MPVTILLTFVREHFTQLFATPYKRPALDIWQYLCMKVYPKTRNCVYRCIYIIYINFSISLCQTRTSDTPPTNEDSSSFSFRYRWKTLPRNLLTVTFVKLLSFHRLYNITQCSLIKIISCHYLWCKPYLTSLLSIS